MFFFAEIRGNGSEQVGSEGDSSWSAIGHEHFDDRYSRLPKGSGWQVRADKEGHSEFFDGNENVLSLVHQSADADAV